MHDAWIICYFESTVVLMVFALGLPAYIFQVVLPIEMRRIILRNKFIFGKFLFLASFGYLSVSFAFIWSASMRGDSGEAFVDAQVLISLCIVASGLFWVTANVRFVPELIVRTLERTLLCTIGWNGGIQGRLLEDLVSMGEVADRGEGKELVLRAIQRIVTISQNRSGYRGNSLDRTIDGMEKICRSLTSGGVVVHRGSLSERNISTAVEILRELVSRARRKGMGQCSDVEKALRAAEEVGSSAIECKAVNALLEVVETISPNSRALSRLGAKALEHGVFESALACLSRLETRILSSGAGGTASDRSYLFGLVAHFWTCGSSAAKHRAQTSLRLLSAGEMPRMVPISDVRCSLHFHLKLGEFETTDCLEVFLRDLQGGTASAA